MAQPQCNNCGFSLMPEDVFCGICGTARPFGPRPSPSPAAVHTRTAFQENSRYQPAPVAPPVPAQPAPGRHQAWPDEPSYPGSEPAFPGSEPAFPDSGTALPGIGTRGQAAGPGRGAGVR